MGRKHVISRLQSPVEGASLIHKSLLQLADECSPKKARGKTFSSRNAAAKEYSAGCYLELLALLVFNLRSGQEFASRYPIALDLDLIFSTVQK
ncbi:hypothetical protein NPIL_91001 [Nephila pilipes]|uniref:Uncharacterized protein n=1 Tax=Nephila pilipes TaxID=299642 RepID=A0A8X6NWD0_NEPPI|nr:hypothetical protein NPIL_91001 [Nephila pilipes]